MHLARELAFRAEVEARRRRICGRPSSTAPPIPTTATAPIASAGWPPRARTSCCSARARSAATTSTSTTSAEIAVRVLQHRSVGALNIATGEVHSFRQVAEQAAALSGRRLRHQELAALGPHAARRLPPVRHRRLPPGLPGFRVHALVPGHANVGSLNPRGAAMTRSVLGIVGGSGLYDIPALKNVHWEDVSLAVGQALRPDPVRRARRAADPLPAPPRARPQGAAVGHQLPRQHRRLEARRRHRPRLRLGLRVAEGGVSARPLRAGRPVHRPHLRPREELLRRRAAWRTCRWPIR